jgi:hypothetical protein
MPKLIGIEDASVDAEYNLEKKDGGLRYIKKKFGLCYLVISDNHSQTEDDIRALTVGLPAIGTPVSGCWCVRQKFKERGRIKHPVTGVPAILWEGLFDFSSDYNSDHEGDQNENPTSAPPVVRWQAEMEDEILERDPITGRRILTSAGEPITVKIPVAHPILEVTRMENAPFDPDIILTYVNHVNSSTFYGAPPGCALMLPIEADEQDVNGTMYAQVRYRVKFNVKRRGSVGLEAETYMLRLLDQGYYYRPEPGKPAIQALDKNAQPITVNLKADGTRLPSTAPDSAAHFVNFNKYPRADLNLLNLGPF